LSYNTSTDIVSIETKDGKKYTIKIKYSWFFDVDRDASIIFRDTDFIGSLCQSMASRIRSTVFSLTNEELKERYQFWIRSSIFGKDQNGKICSNLRFSQNGMSVISAEVFSLESIEEVFGIDRNTIEVMQKQIIELQEQVKSLQDHVKNLEVSLRNNH